MKINFLYCFDKNFNHQALTSINSLLNKVSKKVDLHIIHDDLSSLESLKYKILDHKNIRNLNLYKFSTSSLKLPKAITHVTEATFYRLFISDYLSKEIKNLVYLDADIICNLDPISSLEESFNKMEVENKTLSAYVESTRERKPDYFKRLNLKNNNKLNAGVLLINYRKWVSENTSSKLKEILEEKSTELFDYDQEILNLYFDDNFTKIEKKLNYQVTNNRSISYLQKVKKEAIFVHYLGKDKPWDFFRILIPTSMIYQNEYKKLNEGKLHLTFTKNKRNFFRLLKIIFTLSFLNFEHPALYLKHSFISVFKK